MPTPWERDLTASRERLTGWMQKKTGSSDVRVSELAAPQSSGFSNETLLGSPANRFASTKRA